LIRRQHLCFLCRFVSSITRVDDAEDGERKQTSTSDDESQAGLLRFLAAAKFVPLLFTLLQVRGLPDRLFADVSDFNAHRMALRESSAPARAFCADYCPCNRQPSSHCLLEHSALSRMLWSSGIGYLFS